MKENNLIDKFMYLQCISFFFMSMNFTDISVIIEQNIIMKLKRYSYMLLKCTYSMAFPLHSTYFPKRYSWYFCQNVVL